MPHEDHLIAVALGELHEPAGIIRMIRTENLGAYDAKRSRYKVAVEHRVEQIDVLPRSGEFGRLVKLVSMDNNVKHARARHITLIDVTSAGRAALEPLRKAGIKPRAVAVTGTIGARGAWGAVHIGEAELSARIAIVLAEGRLRVDPAIDGAQELAAQLERHSTGKPVRPPAAQQPFLKPDRQELTRALALALWWGDKMMVARIEQPIRPAPAIDCRAPTFDEAIRMARR